jgi:hypothetical protein
MEAIWLFDRLALTLNTLVKHTDASHQDMGVLARRFVGP